MLKKLFCVALTVLLYAAPAFAAPVPDTGQTGDYTTTFGEDSDYDINPHSYTDLGNGIVRDNVTGLEWVQDGNLIASRDPDFDTDDTAGDGRVTWQHALDYVALLNSENYLGFNDWRLPTVKELSTLVDSSIPYPGRMIDTDFFPDTVASYYWSSTTNASSIGNAWYVGFHDGYVGDYYKTGSYYVRAVRSGQNDPEDRFEDNGDGTITDTSTGLQWQQATAPGTYTWEQALSYCEALVLNNDGAWTTESPNASGVKYDDWRLPSRNELQSIVDYEVYGPAINTSFFPDTVASIYWSSTTGASYTGYAWSGYFHDGYVGNQNEAYDKYVRAVRSGQCGYFGDSDLDGICDDGDASGVPGDNPCTGGNTVFCDDNCPDTYNPDQADSDRGGEGDGIGDACDPTVIDLSGFEAVPGNRIVALIWSTASEIDNAGFNIYRAEGGQYVRINEELIPAEGSATEGAVYEFVDEDVRNRKTYTYRLEDIDLNGVSTLHGPVSATPRLVYY